MTALTPVSAFLPKAPSFCWDWDGLYQEKILKDIFRRMEETPQDMAWHQEGNVFAHTRSVCEALSSLPAYRSLTGDEQEAAALSALLHDMGKTVCTREENGRIISPNHAAVGSRMARALMWREWGISGTVLAQQFRESVCCLIHDHTKPTNILKNGNSELQIIRLADQGRLIPLYSIRLLCLLAEADVCGRICGDQQALLDSVALTGMMAEDLGCDSGPYAFASPAARYAFLQGKPVWKDQDLFDGTWGEVILMSGLPGTGKDTWIHSCCESLPMVSLDEIRSGMGRDAEEGKVAQTAREKARVYLRARTPFVWNATNLTHRRENLVSLFEAYGARVRIVFLETKWSSQFSRNASREHPVPEHVISGMLDRLEVPMPQEAQRVDWICI